MLPTILLPDTLRPNTPETGPCLHFTLLRRRGSWHETVPLPLIPRWCQVGIEAWKNVGFGWGSIDGSKLLLCCYSPLEEGDSVPDSAPVTLPLHCTRTWQVSLASLKGWIFIKVACGSKWENWHWSPKVTALSATFCCRSPQLGQIRQSFWGKGKNT